MNYNNKTNKLRDIKTFEQFKSDNTDANIKTLEYLTLISNNIKNKKADIKNDILGDGWKAYDTPVPDAYENGKITEVETVLEHEETETNIVIVSEYKPMFFSKPSKDAFLPDEESGDITFEIVAITYWTEDFTDEYYIDTKNQVIMNLAKFIIEELEN